MNEELNVIEELNDVRMNVCILNLHRNNFNIKKLCTSALTVVKELITVIIKKNNTFIRIKAQLFDLFISADATGIPSLTVPCSSCHLSRRASAMQSIKKQDTSLSVDLALYNASHSFQHDCNAQTYGWGEQTIECLRMSLFEGRNLVALKQTIGVKDGL